MDNSDKIICQLAETYFSSSSSSIDSSMSESSQEDSASSSNGKNEEDNDLLLFPLMLYLTNGQRRLRIKNYLQIIDLWTDEEFKQHLRLNRDTALKLIDELELSGFIPSHSFGVKPISTKLSFLLFLWYISNTEPLRTMSDRFDISISSVFRVLRRVVAWLLTKFDSMIKWPQGIQTIVVSEKFSSKKGIPKVLGAIDGTHIRIEKPLDRAREYCNRKKFFSISLQAVADADLRFTNVYCGDPGSLHDARILRRSELYHEASINQEILFPDKTFLLGDSAYPSLPWLVPPYRDNGHLTPEQVEFNYIHSSTRMAIERAFGQLKGRFRRIKFFNEYRDLPFVVNTVVAACILHNYCIAENDTYDFPEVLNDCTNVNNTNIEQEVIDNRAVGADRRTELFYELFPNCL